MVFGWLFGKKGDDEKIKKDVEEHKTHIKSIKEDIERAAGWINHLHSKSEDHEFSVGEMNDRLNYIENDLEEIKMFISFFNSNTAKQLSKQSPTIRDKQTAVVGIQTPVQASVQSAFLRNLTSSERMLVWVLLNTEMKLNCEDVSVLLNKDKSTIRGQVNNIKAKSEGLVKEVIENTGKKRFFVDGEMKDLLLRQVRAVKAERKAKKRAK